MHFARLTKLALITTFAATMATQAFAVDATANMALNVRTGPGTNYAIVDALYAGEVVDVTGCQGGWCTISHSGPDGWVSANYLSQVNYGGSINSGSTYSGSTTSNDAATAAAVIGILGIGALLIGGAIASSNDHPHNPRPPRSRICAWGFHWVGPMPGGHCVPN